VTEAPPKKRNRRPFGSPLPTSGKAALHLNEYYKRHIFHLLMSNHRHVGSVQKLLKTIPGAPDSYYSISKVLASLEKYRKLTDPVEFKTFKDCKEDFVIGCGISKQKLSRPHQLQMCLILQHQANLNLLNQIQCLLCRICLP